MSKARNHLSPRQLLFCSILLILFTLLVCLPFFPKWDQVKFEALSKELYLQEMTADTLSLHYSLAYPENFGITDYPVTLPILTPGSEESRPLFLEKLLKKLHAIHPSNLSAADAYAYACLESRLTTSREHSKFPYYSDPLSPAQGIHCQLPILLSEYEFRSKRDVEEYLTLLSQTGLFFESLLQYEQEKAARSLLMSLSSLRKAEEQCDTIVSPDLLKTGEHFLQTSFQDRLAELEKATPLSPKDHQTYLKQNDDILTQVVLPAYQSLKQGLQALEKQAPQSTLGLAALPNGKSYYASLLALETGSAKTPEEIRILLEQKLLQERDTLRQLSQDYPACLTSLQTQSYLDLGMTDSYAMLEDLMRRMNGEFPTISIMQVSSSNATHSLTTSPGDSSPDAAHSLTSGLGGSSSNATHSLTTSPGDSSYPYAIIKEVSPSLQASSAPAFYLTAPIDKTDKNIIYVNPKNTSDSLELYTTLAHEGFPGHLYQNACSAAHLLSMPESRIRQLLSCGGYLEGWALYVEQRSFDYCSQYLAERKRPADAVCVQLEKHHRSLQLCLYSLIDLKIHYDGASLEEITDYLTPFGAKEPATVKALYEYICQCPANYPKYYLGYLEILELKQAALDFCGEHYTDLDFHTFFLKWGPADFENLRKMLFSQTLL